MTTKPHWGEFIGVMLLVVGFAIYGSLIIATVNAKHTCSHTKAPAVCFLDWSTYGDITQAIRVGNR